MSAGSNVNRAKRTGRAQSTGRQTWLGLYLFVAAIILIWLLMKFWPTPAEGPDRKWVQTGTLLAYDFELGDETRLILLVVLAGALGSCIHTGTSFATYVGNRSFVDSWTWWYVLRPSVGMASAVVFYFLIRGGFLLLSSGTAAADVSPHGMAGIAGLVGMFSKQASDKLREVFDNLFRTAAGKGDDVRTDKIGEQLPVEEIMIPLDKMTCRSLGPEKTEGTITLAELHNMFQGIVTRIPVLDESGVARYIIHRSLLDKFIACRWLKDVAGRTEFDPAQATLEEFLGEEEVRKYAAGSMAFIRAKATLAEVMAKMLEKKGCQDVFVTDTGRHDEPVLGWITNVELEKYCRT